MNTETIQFLQSLDACSEGMDWIQTQQDPISAWENCQRGDWMLWLLGKIPSTDRKILVLAACECARQSLHLVPEGEDRPRLAIETAEKWACGEASLREVKTAAAAAARAADAAATAAYTAARAAAYYAADAAAAAARAAARAAAYYAADAAGAAAYTAARAAAYYAADAAGAATAADAAAREESLAESAKIVRKYFPSHPSF